MPWDQRGWPTRRKSTIFCWRGACPSRFDEDRFRELLGGEKYRGHLNYFYGVTVEEALQVAVETEIVKRLVSNGYTDTADVSDEALLRIYRNAQGRAGPWIQGRDRNVRRGGGCGLGTPRSSPTGSSSCA